MGFSIKKKRMPTLLGQPLPPGRGEGLPDAVQKLVRQHRVAIPAAYTRQWHMEELFRPTTFQPAELAVCIEPIVPWAAGGMKGDHIPLDDGLPDQMVVAKDGVVGR